MRTVQVEAIDGTRWTVRVVWEPRWRFLARRFGGWRRNRRDTDVSDALEGGAQFANAVPGGGGGGGGDFDLGDAVVVIVVACFAFIAAAALFWWVLLPLLLIVLDLAIVLILLVLAVAGRVLLRRPWTVQAQASDGRRFTVDVVGWRAALAQRDEIANGLRLGHQHRAAAA